MRHRVNNSMLLISFIIGLFFVSATSMAAQQHEVNGVVKAVKKDSKKLTIQHGPIKSMGMSGMTMDFAVYDPAMLSEVSTGQKVSFMIEVDKAGNFVIMEIEDMGK